MVLTAFWSCRVSLISARPGVVSPDGWLWARITAEVRSVMESVTESAKTSLHHLFPGTHLFGNIRQLSGHGKRLLFYPVTEAIDLIPVPQPFFTRYHLIGIDKFPLFQPTISILTVFVGRVVNLFDI